MKRISLIAIVAAVLSLIVNALAAEFIIKPLPILGQFVSLYVTYNPGIAFGIALPSLLQETLILAALALVLWIAYSDKERTDASSWGYGLVLGGALSNIFDRLPDGVVTDYISVQSFSVFNVADACITVGAILLVLDILLKQREKRR